MTEFNPFLKSWKKGLKRVAIVYPNRYVGGISSLAVQRLYYEINSSENFIAERFFTDVFEGLRSVESGNELKSFDVALFTLQYEEDYFNAIQIIKRSKFSGVKIAGGPCVTENPKPIAKFFDGLFIGEADNLVLDIIEGKLELYPRNRKRLLWRELPEHQKMQVIGEGAYGRALHIEIGRGCPRACRFCIVRQLYSPARWRKVEEILEVAEENRKIADKVALIAPSPSDHPKFEEIIAELYSLGYQISPSSLRADRISEETLRMLVKSGLRSLTFAPETNERLREVIKKDISDEDIISAAKLAKDAGIEKVKLYFMIGLPGEKLEDLEEIVSLVEKIRSMNLKVSVSVNPLVPKPHTPFQWLPYGGGIGRDVKENIKSLEERARFLEKMRRFAEVNIESVRKFAIQTVLSRGDEKVSKFIELKPNFNLIFKLKLDKFLEAFEVDEELPWDDLEVGYKKERLKKEYERVLAEISA